MGSPDPPESDADVVDQCVKDLTSPDWRKRMGAAGVLGDFFEAWKRNPEQARRAAEALLQSLVVERHGEAREEMLNTLCLALQGKSDVAGLRVDELVAAIDRLSVAELVCALYFVGFCGDRQHRKVAASFLWHHDPDVREAAVSTIMMLDD